MSFKASLCSHTFQFPGSKGVARLPRGITVSWPVATPRPTSALRAAVVGGGASRVAYTSVRATNAGLVAGTSWSLFAQAPFYLGPSCRRSRRADLVCYLPPGNARLRHVAPRESAANRAAMPSSVPHRDERAGRAPASSWPASDFFSHRPLDGLCRWMVCLLVSGGLSARLALIC